MTAYAAAFAHFGPTSRDAPEFHTSAWPQAQSDPAKTVSSATSRRMLTLEG